jgi:hypothetical protein
MASTGELDLSRLLATLEPKLQDGEYVFATLTDKAAAAACAVDAIGTFAEAEGITLIVPTAGYSGLPAGTACSGVQRMITLTCHSSLEAVGLTYRVSQRLASLGISCNVVAAYFHDHIFVAHDKADTAVEALRALQAESKAVADGAGAAHRCPCVECTCGPDCQCAPGAPGCEPCGAFQAKAKTEAAAKACCGGG